MQSLTEIFYHSRCLKMAFHPCMAFHTHTKECFLFETVVLIFQPTQSRRSLEYKYQVG